MISCLVYLKTKRMKLKQEKSKIPGFVDSSSKKSSPNYIVSNLYLCAWKAYFIQIERDDSQVSTNAVMIAEILLFFVTQILFATPCTIRYFKAPWAKKLHTVRLLALRRNKLLSKHRCFSLSEKKKIKSSHVDQLCLSVQHWYSPSINSAGMVSAVSFLVHSHEKKGLQWKRVRLHSWDGVWNGQGLWKSQSLQQCCPHLSSSSFQLFFFVSFKDTQPLFLHLLKALIAFRSFRFWHPNGKRHWNIGATNGAWEYSWSVWPSRANRKWPSRHGWRTSVWKQDTEDRVCVCRRAIFTHPSQSSRRHHRQEVLINVGLSMRLAQPARRDILLRDNTNAAINEASPPPYPIWCPIRAVAAGIQTLGYIHLLRKKTAERTTMNSLSQLIRFRIWSTP